MDEMRRKLPDYICNCLEVTGFDNADAICEIDRNTLTKIVEKHKKNLPSCIRQNDSVMMSTHFEFPLGHAILILKFASSIKMMNNKCKLKNSTADKPSSKKRKVMETAKLPDTVPAVTDEIRKKILKWTRDYKKGEDSSVAGMTEGVDFFIDVKVSEIDTAKCDASIHCRCGKSYLVLVGSRGERIINSWVKHVKTCLREKPSISQDIVTFFTPSQEQTSNAKTNQSPVPPAITTAANTVDTLTDVHVDLHYRESVDILSNLSQLPAECHSGTELTQSSLFPGTSLLVPVASLSSPATSSVTSPLPPTIEEINDHTDNPADSITSSSPQVFQ